MYERRKPSKLSAKAAAVRVGDKYADWEVISEPFMKGTATYVECRCGCGAVKEIQLASLINGCTSRCRKCSVLVKRYVKVGDKYNILEVVEAAPPEDGKVMWRCRCDCGDYVVVSGANLLSGGTKRCPTCKNALFCTGVDRTQWCLLKRGARLRGLSVEVEWIELKELLDKQGGLCALSGVPIVLADSHASLQSGQRTASVDRIDSNKGYTLDNVQWIHKDVNFMKQEYPQDYFLAFCRAITLTHPGSVDADHRILNQSP